MVNSRKQSCWVGNNEIGTHTPFNLPVWNVFHVHVLSSPQGATLCQKTSSGRLGGSLRTTVLRRTALFWPGPLPPFFGFLVGLLLSTAVAIWTLDGGVVMTNTVANNAKRENTKYKPKG